MVFLKIYKAPEVRKNEVLRYAGCKSGDFSMTDILNDCITEAKPNLIYKVCYSVFDVKICDGVCDFGAFSVKSNDLAKNLQKCRKAVIFAATVGTGIDRLISKYGAVSPSKALFLQAFGAERIESLCDLFCEDIKAEFNTELRPRYSPGYGDFDILFQKDIFKVLNCGKHIGLTLNDSLLMSPSKSVTAVVGLCDEACEIKNKCSDCDKKDCIFRGAL